MIEEITMYNVKESFYSLQGEGAHAGRPAIFCRFTGCNLWSGKEKHRLSADCQFCDTDFNGVNGQNGGRFKSADELAKHIANQWPQGHGNKYVVFTGGEPALQLDQALISAVKSYGFMVAIETNGTLRLPDNIDWICVSPKTTDPLVVNAGNELKFVYPQTNLNPKDYEGLEFEHFYLQPMDLSAVPKQNIIASDTQSATLKYCLENPLWRISLQTHKMLNID